MCGICGFAGFRDESLVREMTNLLRHRGPDEFGFFMSDKVSFGHRRLSIIDLDSGKQPIYNENRSIVLICNGEIYNYKELTESLIKKGHKFYTKSDSEVLAHLYEDHGMDCIKFINGMFAFAIWDAKKERLFLSRDRLGIRQLYYMINNNKLVFSSEFKSIMQYKDCAKDIDAESMDKFITFRYVPGPSTIVKKIKKLQPAHSLTWEKGEIKIWRYWNLNMQQLDINEHEANNRFSDLFKESVNMRLMSDVPYGAYLSGGVDSSSILAIMKEFVQDKIKTFSIGFKNEFDELKQARQVADFFGTEHNEIEMEPKDLYLLPKVLWHMDDPYGDAIVLPMYLLSRLARKKVKVVLTGEGADELLGGYVYQKNMYLGYIFDRLFQSGIKRRMTSNFVKAIPEDLLNKFFHYPSHLGQEGKNRLVRYLNTFNNLGENYLSLTGLFTAEDKQSLYSGYLKNELSNSRKNSPEDEIRYLLERKKGSNYFNDLLNLGFGHWLSDNILFSQDKTAMANSIETRVPFLDHRLVEFVCTLPVKYKLRNFITDKYILRESMRKALPKTSSKRRKQAFRVPVESSFKKPFDELINIYLSEKRIRKRNYFNYDFIKKLISKKEDEMLYNMQLMALVMLEMWFEVFLDKRTKIFEEAGVL